MSFQLQQQRQQIRQWSQPKSRTTDLQETAGLFRSVPQQHGITSEAHGTGSGLRQSSIEQESPTLRLLLAVTNDATGNESLGGLRARREELGYTFVGTLGEILRGRGIENVAQVDELRDKFAFLEIPPGDHLPIMNEILRLYPYVDVELDQRMRYAGAALGPDFKLRSPNSMHDRYLRLLNTSAAASNGTGVKIAVIDSGFERTGVLAGFLDLVEPTNKIEKDNFGHGTAMASIIKDVAKGAKVFAVRTADQEPDCSDAMLGIGAGAFKFKPDILNLSFGFSAATACPHCGAQAPVSRVFQRFLYSLSETPIGPNGVPVLIAATGNDASTTGFDSPACWDFTLAVGSITQCRDRSAFSNYGTKLHAQYIMMPGGEEQKGTISEWVGEATHKCYGTSVAAAYASGVLALYMSDKKYRKPDRALFLQNVLAQCKKCKTHQPVVHGLGYLPYKPAHKRGDKH